MAGEERGAKWQIDRRIPVIPVILLTLQALGFVVYAAKLDSRVATVEEKILKNEPMIERVARLEEKLWSLEKQGDRIETKLDKAIEKGN